MIRFTDGTQIDPSGELRVILLKDGYYVVGHGMVVPVDSRLDGEELIKELKRRKP